MPSVALMLAGGAFRRAPSWASPITIDGPFRFWACIFLPSSQHPGAYLMLHSVWSLVSNAPTPSRPTLRPTAHADSTFCCSWDRNSRPGTRGWGCGSCPLSVHSSHHAAHPRAAPPLPGHCCDRLVKGFIGPCMSQVRTRTPPTRSVFLQAFPYSQCWGLGGEGGFHPHFLLKWFPHQP